MACFVVGELAHHDRRRGRTIRFPPKKADFLYNFPRKKGLYRHHPFSTIYHYVHHITIKIIGYFTIYDRPQHSTVLHTLRSTISDWLTFSDMGRQCLSSLS